MEKYELPGPYIEADKQLFTITFVRPDLQKKTIQERMDEVEKGIKTWEKVGRKVGKK